MNGPPRVAVVGAGVSGLTAAYRLRRRFGPHAQITVVEQRDRIGGVLRTVELAGVPFDLGAEAFLARRPEVPALLAELGLADRMVHPTGARATIRAGGHTWPLPAGTLLGLPGSTSRLDGLLSPAGAAAAAAEPGLPLSWEPGTDVVLGTLVRARFGDELADRLVDPLLGGVQAGRVDALGLRATVPALAAALDAGASSLTAAVDAVVGGTRSAPVGRAPIGGAPVGGTAVGGAVGGAVPGPRDRRRAALPVPESGAPVFGAIRGGYRVLLDALADASAPDLRLGTTVRAVEQTAAGWLLVLGPTTAPEALEVDAVVLAVPAPAVARLLERAAPASAAAAAGIELASSVVVALAYEPTDVAAPTTSGVLVATDEPLSVKGITHSTTKWAHLDPDGLVRLRTSSGRFGEAHTLQVDDAVLVARARIDLAVLDGIAAEPVEVHVQRWGGGLPQYGIGHGRRVAALLAGLPDGLAVAGSALHGVGVPACIGTGGAAAERVAGEIERVSMPSWPASTTPS